MSIEFFLRWKNKKINANMYLKLPNADMTTTDEYKFENYPQVLH